MTNKTTKDAVEHFGGVWPEGKGNYLIYTTEANTKRQNEYDFMADSPFLDSFNKRLYKGREHRIPWIDVCTKQQFEDCVKEQKMEKQYKYVNAGIKTVGELFQALLLDEIQIFHNESQVTINGYADVYCGDFGVDRLKINRIDAMLPALTTRQTIPWYEVDGVFPCVVRRESDGFVFCATDFYDGYLKSSEQIRHRASDFVMLATIKDLREISTYEVE